MVIFRRIKAHRYLLLCICVLFNNQPSLAQSEKELIWQINSNLFQRVVSHTARSHSGDRISVVTQSGLDNYFQEYSVKTGGVLSQADVGFSSPGKVTYSSDDKEILLGYDGKLQYWNIEQQSIHATHTLAKGMITSLEVSQDGKYVVNSNSIGVVQVRKYGVPEVFREYVSLSKQYVEGLAWLSDQNKIAFSIADSIYLWDIENNLSPVFLFRTYGSSAQFAKIQLDPNSNSLYVLSDSLYKCSLPNGKVVDRVKLPSTTRSGIFDFEKGLAYISAFSISDGKMYLLSINLTNYALSEPKFVYWGDFTMYDFMSNGDILARYNLQSVGVYHLSSATTTPYILPISGIADVQYSARDDKFYIASENSELLAIDANDRSIIIPPFYTGVGIASISLSDSLPIALLACTDPRLLLYNTAFNDLVGEINTAGLNSNVDFIKCKISDDAKYAVAICSDSTMRIWSIEGDQQISTYKSKWDITSVDVSRKYVGISTGSKSLFFDISTGVAVDSIVTLGEGMQFISDDVVIAPPIRYVIGSQKFKSFGFGIYFTAASDGSYVCFINNGNPVKIYDLTIESVVYTYDPFREHPVYEEENKFILLNNTNKNLLVAAPLGTMRLLKNMAPSLKVSHPELHDRSANWSLSSMINPTSLRYIGDRRLLKDFDLYVYGVSGALLNSSHVYWSSMNSESYDLQPIIKGLSPGVYTIILDEKISRTNLKFLIHLQ